MRSSDSFKGAVTELHKRLADDPNDKHCIRGGKFDRVSTVQPPIFNNSVVTGVLSVT